MGVPIPACCCCGCGVACQTAVRVTISGYTIGCCPNPSGKQPQAALYGTWDINKAFVPPLFSQCLWEGRITPSPAWTWNDYSSSGCGTPSGTFSSDIDIRFELVTASRTGTVDQWEIEFMGGGTGAAVNCPQFRGHLDYAAGCATTLTFSNNGIYRLGVLNNAAGTGGSITVEMCH